MKILWIVPGPDESSNMPFAKRTIPALEGQGLSVRVFHLTSRSNPLALARLWKSARDLVAAFEPDLVHAQYGSVAAVFACALGRPSAVTFRGSDVNGDPDLPWHRQAVSWTASQLSALLADGAIYVSERLKGRLVYTGRLTACLPSPLNLEVFRPRPKAECRRSLGLPLEGKIVSFVSVSGRAVKRPQLAKAVCELLRRRGRQTRLLEITRVEPAEIPLWLCASDCLLFTSRREGSPNAVREALACGVPAVSVRVGDVERWISRDPYSRVVDSDSPDALADAVEQVWDLPEPRARRAELSDVGCEVHARALASFYREVIRAG